MNHRVIFATIALTLLIVGYSELFHAGFAIRIMELNREVEVVPGGLVYIIDKLTLPQSGVFRLGFRANYKPSILSFYTLGAEIELKLIESENNIFLEGETKNPEKHTMVVVSVLKGMVSEPGNKRFIARLPFVPVLEAKLDRLDYRVLFPPGSEIASVQDPRFTIANEEPARLTATTNNLEEFSWEEISVPFTSEKLPIITVEFAEVKFEYGEKPVIDAFHRVRNRGATPFDKVVLKLPYGAEVKNARDSIGPLRKSFDQEKSVVEVTLRQAVRTGEAASFHIVYQAAAGSLLKKVGEDTRLSLPILLNSTHDSYNILFLIPQSLEVLGSSPEPELFSKHDLPSTILEYRLENLAHSPINTVSVRLSPAFTLAPYQPLFWGLIITFSALAVVVYFGRPQAQRVEIASPEITRLRNDAVVRLSAISSQIETMKSYLSDSQVTSEKAEKTLRDTTMMALGREKEKLVDLRKRLEKLEPTIANRIRDAERLQGEITDVLTAMMRVREDSRIGRLPKAAAASVYKEYEKILNSHQRNLASVVEELTSS